MSGVRPMKIASYHIDEGCSYRPARRDQLLPAVICLADDLGRCRQCRPVVQHFCSTFRKAWGIAAPDKGPTPHMAVLVRVLRYLLTSEYDFVFFQDVGGQQEGAHVSVKAPASNQPNIQAS